MNRDFVEMLSALSAAGVKFGVGFDDAWERRMDIAIGTLTVWISVIERMSGSMRWALG